ARLSARQRCRVTPWCGAPPNRKVRSDKGQNSAQLAATFAKRHPQLIRKSNACGVPVYPQIFRRAHCEWDTPPGFAMSDYLRLGGSTFAVAGATPDRRRTPPRCGDKTRRRIGSGSAIGCPAAPLPDATLGAYLHILLRDTATPALGRRSTSIRRSGHAPSSDRLARARSRSLFAPDENGSIFVRAANGSVADGMPIAGACHDNSEWTTDGAVPRPHTLAAAVEHSPDRGEGRGNAAGPETAHCPIGSASCDLSIAVQLVSANCAQTILIPSPCLWALAP